MTEGAAVREYHFLPQGIYEGNEITINNQTFANADETVVILIKHVGDASLYLSQLHSQGKPLTVGQGDGRIIAVGSDKYHCIGGVPG